MTSVQHRAAAAGFLHVLHTSPEVYKEWSPIKKDDYPALGKLIQKSVGLHETPTKEDIYAMASHVDKHLKEEAASFHQAHPEAPHHVGSFAMMQQS